jgi:peptidoglycan/LPS O-acetylase OafA/YrhL
MFLISPLPTLLPIFASGVWAADLCSGRPLRRWESLLIIAAPYGLCLTIVVWLTNRPPSQSTWSEWVSRDRTRAPVAFFAVLSAVTSPTISRFLSMRWLEAVGLFSYSLYLVHTPVIEAIRLSTCSSTWPPVVQLLFYQGPVFALAVSCGYCFYLVAERPFLARR